MRSDVVVLASVSLRNSSYDGLFDHQLVASGCPSAYPAAVCSPTTARSWNSSRFAAPTYVQELRIPDTIESSRSSTLGRSGSRYIRAVEMPSSKKLFRARWNGVSSVVRDRTARADAIPKLSL